MNTDKLHSAFDDRDPAADGRRGGVCLLAEVLPELLARYQVSDENEDGWIDPVFAGEPVAC